MLEINGLGIAYGEKQVVSDVSFSVSPGEIIGIVGESGSGKSTVLKSILSLLGPDGNVTDGTIFFDGTDLRSCGTKKLREIRGERIGMIFQHPMNSFDPTVILDKQFYEAVRIHEKVPKEEVRRRSEQLLTSIGFEDPGRVLASYPFELSGGMCQRAAIALAMLREPSLLLADEPTSALDVTVQAQVVQEMIRLCEERGTAVLIVTHNMGVVAAMANKVGVMYKGRLVEFGTKEEVLHAPKHEYTQRLLAAVPRMPEVE